MTTTARRSRRARSGSATTAPRTPARASSARSSLDIRATRRPSALWPGFARRAPAIRSLRGTPRDASSWAPSPATTRPARRRRSATNGSPATSIPAGPAATPSMTAAASPARSSSRKGSSAPNLLGKFHDKTAIEADRTDTVVPRQRVLRLVALHRQRRRRIYFVRSTDHGVTFSQPMKLTAGVHDVQLPEISVTGNGHVYVTYGQFEDSGHQVDGVGVVKSTDCGKTFSRPATITNVAAMGLTDALLGRRQRPRLRRRRRDRMRERLHLLPRRHRSARRPPTRPTPIMNGSTWPTRPSSRARRSTRTRPSAGPTSRVPVASRPFTTFDTTARRTPTRRLNASRRSATVSSCTRTSPSTTASSMRSGGTPETTRTTTPRRCSCDRQATTRTATSGRHSTCMRQPGPRTVARGHPTCS